MDFRDAITALQGGADGIALDRRRRLVSAIADCLLTRDSDKQTAAELIELLANDPDWTVRLEVAQMAHLLDDDTCSRFVAMFRTDCNRYVRSHAERSLTRQRKARQSSERRRSGSRSCADQLDQVARQYGKPVAAKVRSLADERFAMLAAAVAHDMRSILTTLSANAAALAGEHDSSERVASIQEDVGFLRRTIDAMEQFTRPLPVQRLPEDLVQMIRQAVEKARESVIQQGHDPSAVQIDVQRMPSLRLRVSRQLIVLALTNVIQNALESFAVPGRDALRPGRIEVQITVSGYETRVVVTDDGPGIEPSVLEELTTFVPSGPNKHKRVSSGWGLSLVNRNITAHGGTVQMDSEEGAGTTVVLTLPRQDTDGGDDA